jgi:hypothetical protein
MDEALFSSSPESTSIAYRAYYLLLREVHRYGPSLSFSYQYSLFVYLQYIVLCRDRRLLSLFALALFYLGDNVVVDYSAVQFEFSTLCCAVCTCKLVCIPPKTSKDRLFF